MAELPPAEEIIVREILDKYLTGEIDLICVLGPTASGKTRYAVHLAREINSLLDQSCTREVFLVAESLEDRATRGTEAGGPQAKCSGGVSAANVREASGTRKTGAEIISADSRQVYRGMDIGTGKDLSEYEEIPYHLMDIVDAGEKYNIFEYQRDFEKAYKDIRERGGIPILCGGSGLYIDVCIWKLHRRAYKKVIPSGEKGTVYCVSFGNTEIFFFFTISVLYFENQSENICLIGCLLRIQ